MRVGSGLVVCGVDFSDASRHALQVAAALATRLSEPLVVVSAIDPLIADAAAVSMGPAFAERLTRDLDGFVQESVASGSGQSVSLLMPVGPAANELLRVANDARAGTIVIGTEGLGRARRVFFGSTTLRVMRGADRAVLAVPPPREGVADSGIISRILCGVDFSNPSLTAAREAVDLARRLSVPVTLLHGVGRLPMPPLWDLRLVPSDAERVAKAKADLMQLAASLGAPEPATVAAMAEPGELFAREATPGTLLVLGLGDLSGHRPGSTAMRIMAATHLPVLAVPGSN